MQTIRFSADVLGTTRSVDIDIDHPALARWSVEWADGKTQGGVPAADDIESIEITVMNTYPLFAVFYEGAVCAEFDADLTDVTVELV